MVTSFGAVPGGMYIPEYLAGSVRSIESLINLGDMTREVFSDQEMEMIVHHAWEKSMFSNKEHEQESWMLLQYNLQRLGMQVELFPPDGQQYAVLSDIEFKHLFHRLRTASVGLVSYHKRDWKVFARQLWLRGIQV